MSSQNNNSSNSLVLHSSLVRQFKESVATISSLAPNSLHSSSSSSIDSLQSIVSQLASPLVLTSISKSLLDSVKHSAFKLWNLCASLDHQHQQQQEQKQKKQVAERLCKIRSIACEAISFSWTEPPSPLSSSSDPASISAFIKRNSELARIFTKTAKSWAEEAETEGGGDMQKAEMHFQRAATVSEISSTD